MTSRGDLNLPSCSAYVWHVHVCQEGETKTRQKGGINRQLAGKLLCGNHPTVAGHVRPWMCGWVRLSHAAKNSLNLLKWGLARTVGHPAPPRVFRYRTLFFLPPTPPGDPYWRIMRVWYVAAVEMGKRTPCPESLRIATAALIAVWRASCAREREGVPARCMTSEFLLEWEPAEARGSKPEASRANTTLYHHLMRCETDLICLCW